MRLINADAFIEEARNRIDMQDAYLPIHIKYFVIDEMPTIEAEPVKHGKWKIKTINRFDLAYGTTAYEPCYQCSECGGVVESYLRLDEPIMPEDADFPRYCSICGARMEGAEG